MIRRIAISHWHLLAVALLLMGTGAGWVMRFVGTSESAAAMQDRSTDALAGTLPGSAPHAAQSSRPPGSSTFPGQHQARQNGARHLVTVRQPTGPPRVDLGILDAAGKSVTAACATCHSTRLPNYANHSPTDFDEFHQSVAVTHGKVSCLSCHNPDDYDTLRLADGTPVEYAEVMTLCSQCHAPQARDYKHGAHGGMTGYWDLSRGPRTRHNCIDCHDPHAPSFPAMKPTFKPRDRFLNSDDSRGANRHE